MNSPTEELLRTALHARAELVTAASLSVRTTAPALRPSWRSSWFAATAAAVLVAAVLGATLIGITLLNGHPTSPPVLGTATSASSVSPTPRSSTAPATPSAKPSTTTAAPAPPSGRPVPGTHLINLTLTDPVRGQLVAAYVAALHYSPAWITGTKPGSVYYAYDTRTHAYLAWAGFIPSPTAPPQVSLGMQDGGYRTAFRQLPGQPWQKFNLCDNPEFNAFIGARYGHC